MNYESLKKILTDKNSNVWINGKKIAMDKGIAVWEYDFCVLGGSRVVIRGVESNNPKMQTASSEYGVFIDGKKLQLEQSEYLDLFGQAGYLYSIIQPAKLQDQFQSR